MQKAARWRVPGFAMDYLEGGCHSEVNLKRNTEDIRRVKLRPYYLREYQGADLSTELFGHTYAAPFGMSPVGLQGLMWPGSCEILAKAAVDNNIPFVLSTVSTASIETIAKITDGQAWFQLYHPAEDDLRDQILKRAQDAGCPVLMILADTPTFGYRAREIRNGLSIPPRMTMRNVMQMMTKPLWCMEQLKQGAPEFKTLKPYIPQGMSMKHLGLFMNKTFNGRLNADRVAAIREIWKGKLVIKGVVNEEDATTAIEQGVDGIIVSNHGGRQLDAGESTIDPMSRLVEALGDKTTIMMDSGIRTGSDVACSLARGASFTFLGRTFMYGVGALGKKGGDHVIAMLTKQLQQVMEQLACEKVSDFPKHLLPAE